MPFNGKESVRVYVLWIRSIFLCFFLEARSVIDNRRRRSFSVSLFLHIGNGSANDANQMLLNIPSNQPRISTTVSTHCSLPSSHQGQHDGEEQERVNENNIDDNQQRRRRQGKEGEEDAPSSSSSSHNDDVGSTDIAAPPSTKKKLKHCYSSTTLLPPLIPRSSSTLTTAAMLQHPRHETYRTLQLPVNSNNKLLILTPNGQQRPIVATIAASENNLQATRTRILASTSDQPHDGNRCFGDDSVRTLSRGELIFVKSV